MRNRKESIVAILHAMETEKLIEVWNNYCSEENMEDYIYDNDEYAYQDLFGGSGNGIDEALRAAFYGDFRYSDEYVVLNVYGNLVSFDEYDAESHIDFDTLAEFIMDNGCDEITEVWYEDIYADFVDWFNETQNMNINVDEDTDFYNSVKTWNLVTDEWEDIAKDVLEDMKENNNE